MKKSIIVVLAVVLLVLASGCSKVVVEDSLILVESNGELTKPYENYIWSENYNDEHGGWLSSDGFGINYKFSEVKDQIPQITYNDDFKIHFKDGVSLRRINLYFSDFEPIPYDYELDDLKSLAKGEYYLAINVMEQGRFIEQDQRYECSGYECVYKMIK